MTYELAKKLKDAGFPQSNIGEKKWYLETCEECEAGNPEFVRDFKTREGAIETYLEEGMIIKIPTLEELISACGMGEIVINILDGIYANARKVAMELDGEGSTPSEAVANLWLALNAPKENQT